jgi:hypothetical protein
MKYKVKLALHKKKDGEKADLGETTHDKMNGNPLFATPNPALPAYKTAYTDYRTAYENALLGGKPLKAILKVKRDAFIVLLKQMAAYVNNIANGDAAVITSAGFDINSPPLSHVMTKVTGVTGSTSAHTGEVDLEWSKVDGCMIYLVYAKPVGDSASAYVLKVKTSRGHAIINGLNPGVMYEFVIEPVGNGTNNVGPLSDPVQARAQF